MTAQPAFLFDASACSGCKACQAACKDKNHLPPGVLWRRVYEVTGGSWQRNGAAWSNTVFVYHLSLSCNHCVHPKCAGVCPTDAYTLRPDGIVLLETAKCTGCGYCAWACPYEAPQYDPLVGHMTKCNLCFDELDRGLMPACVAACPMRVLEYGQPRDGQTALWEVPAQAHPFPLPPNSHTEPRVAIKPHAGMSRSEEKSVANAEEIRPRVPTLWQELPLVLFTLLIQMAVGGFLAAMWAVPPDARDTALLLVSGSLASGMLASFAHLGTKKNAWRVLGHLRKSWLSREILFTLLFGAGWMLTLVDQVGWPILTAVFGLALVHSMAQVYRLPAAPGWNTWRTNAGFLLSAVLLGMAVMAPLLRGRSLASVITLILLIAQLLLARQSSIQGSLQHIRIGLILLAMFLLVIDLSGAWSTLLILFLIVCEEGLGRCLFYQSRLRTLRS